MEKYPQNNIPTILFILGATGDLTARKIAPALFSLHDKGRLPTMFRIIGVARRDLSDDAFQKLIAGHIKKRVKNVSQKKLDSFLGRLSYHQAEFENRGAYNELKKISSEIDDGWGVCSNKLFYLAVPPQYYELITRHLSGSGLTDPCSPEEGWTRVLVEKPFGENYDSAHKLDVLLGKLFKEVQIYRIDHYLGKEMIQNILTFRFSNTLFEKIWNKDFIERIDIRLLETIGVEERGAYYDSTGAFRDVGQNHLLQMLAFITMDHPQSFESDAIRLSRSTLLNSLEPLTTPEIKKQTHRAQYTGYKGIQGVKRNSSTETYFKIGGAFLDAPRWQGVPITLESGKRLNGSRKDITVTFRHPTPCLCPPGKEHYKNKMVFSLEPQEGIDIQFWSKKPGLTFDIEEAALQFNLRGQKDRVQYIEEYEKLLLDCIVGDQTLFITTDEVRAMWRFTDPVVDAWGENAVPLETYKPDTDEPLEKSAYIEDAITTPRATPEELVFGGEKKIGVVGLGKMGENIARRLSGGGWDVIGYDKNREARAKLLSENFEIAATLKKFIEELPNPRIVWLMLPAGKPTDGTIEKITPLLSGGDIVIDGGNSHFKDSVERHKELAKRGVHFVDVGVSGGPEGAIRGASLMVGGNRKVFEKLEPLFANLAHENGYRFFEGAGAGHFIKMVHNGIEYGMMQAIAEGFQILKKSSYKLDLAEVAGVYNNGSVIESRLIDWLINAFETHGEDLKKVSGKVAHSGEGEWTVKTAKELGVAAKIIEGSLKFRKLSEKNPTYAGKILSALREQFGGHNVIEKP